MRRLAEFVEWFLAVAPEQVRFMNSHFRLADIARSLERAYVPRRQLDPRLAKVLVELVRLGELPRGSVQPILAISARTATTLIAQLLEDGIVVSRDPREPFRLHFGPDTAEILFSGLFGTEALLSSSPN